MTLTIVWIAGLARRRSARLAGTAVCVALAVGLFASLGAFVASSNAGMTRRAIAGVPVDWQIELARGARVAPALAKLRASAEVRAVREVKFADAARLVAQTGDTVQTTGAGVVVGLPADYATVFPGEVRFLAGSHAGALLAQQTAANLHVGVGDELTIGLPTGTEVPVRVGGIVDLPAADSLFQTVGAPAGAGATAPPDNVILLPLERFRTMLAPLAAARPDAVRTQLHVRLARDLPADPSEAYTALVESAHNLEARFAGGVTVGDNLGAMLDAARKDAVYSQLLFLFLGLPGIILACMLALVAGASGEARRRSEQALLRIRGATQRRILALAAAEAALVAAAGLALGCAVAYGIDRVMFAQEADALTAGSFGVWAAAAAVLGVVLAASAIVLPARRDARSLTVRAAQASVGAARRPLWERTGLDVILLAGAGLVFWQSMRDAYQVVLVPEGVPTISINYLTLLAPMLFWAGAALLTWRVADTLLARRAGLLAAVMRPFAGSMAGTVAASMSRQRRLVARSMVLVALAVSFAVSVSIFNTTYMNQARVDAELTNGADVTVTAGSAGLPDSLEARVTRLSGVSAARVMQHRLAYVGNDLQDLYAIDPDTIGQATTMSDAYFQGGTAAQVLATLASMPDGILVSDETVKDFQLHLGDTVNIRLQSPTDHAYHPVPFRYVGVVREFPTAPHDSFLVVNRSYVTRMTGSSVVQTLLVKTDVDPVAVARSVRGLLGPAAGVRVTDLRTQLKQTLSGLTAIDLGGLTRLELAFAVVMAIVASGLVLVLTFSERRRTFAIAHALGARPSQLAAFVWSEVSFVTLGGVMFGLVSGAIEALIIIKVLTGVFDPPPESMLVPWGYLAGVAAAIGLSVGVAGHAAVSAARKPALEAIRDL